MVGLKSLDGNPVPRGAQLVADPNAAKPVPMLGHVASQCYSPHVGAHIGLGLLIDRAEWMGRRVFAVCELTSKAVPVEVTSPVFIDPDGGRARG